MVTLSRFGHAELEKLAAAKGEPLGKLASRIIEQQIESPAFGALVRRALEHAAEYEAIESGGDGEK